MTAATLLTSARAGLTARRLPRTLHPAAWWLWALGMAAAASRTTNPALLALVIVVVALVVAARRGSAPWALSFRLYVIAAVTVVVLRVVFRVVFNGAGQTVLVTLPTLQLPDWFWGATLLGPVSAEALLSAGYDGLRLGTMIICVGAANALADPKRLLAAMPSALTEISTVLVVALSVFPQLAESVVRVSRARALRASAVARGRGRRRRQWVRSIVVPVLADALDRSLALAAAMDSRGYGRRRRVPRPLRVLSALLVLLGTGGLLVGVFALFYDGIPLRVAQIVLVAGLLVAALGLRLAGLRTTRTRYRRDRWRPAELLVVGSAAAVVAVVFRVAERDPLQLYPTIFPPSWPVIGLGSVVGVLLGLGALAAPVPETAAGAAAPAHDLELVR